MTKTRCGHLAARVIRTLCSRKCLSAGTRQIIGQRSRLQARQTGSRKAEFLYAGARAARSGYFLIGRERPGGVFILANHGTRLRKYQDVSKTELPWVIDFNSHPREVGHVSRRDRPARVDGRGCQKTVNGGHGRSGFDRQVGPALAHHCIHGQHTVFEPFGQRVMQPCQQLFSLPFVRHGQRSLADFNQAEKAGRVGRRC